MNIIGVCAYDLNPAACLLVEGKLVAFAEEERFTRIKQAEDVFPIQAMKYCMDTAGLSLKDIHFLAVGWDYNLYRFKVPLHYVREYVKSTLNLKRYFEKSRGIPSTNEGFIDLFKKQPSHVIARTVRVLKQRWPEEPVPEIRFLNHHLCHSCSTFFCSGQEKAAILTYDGSGELHSATLGAGTGTKINIFQKISNTLSVGDFYSAFTEYLGFSPHRNEGKLMGLAAYGEDNPEIEKKMDRILRPGGKNVYSLDSSYILVGSHSFGRFYSDRLVKLFGPPRARDEDITHYHYNIAYSAQKRLEQVAMALVSKAISRSGYDTLCMGGGVALNCSTNMVLREQAGVKTIYIPPMPHDAGTALGAAMIIALEHGFDPRFHMVHPYWGPSFSSDTVEKTLLRLGLDYYRPGNLEKDVAGLLADGKTVGWFQGRMEIGPRALGARSILANPGISDMKDRLNLKVKGREPWRPFAPSGLVEHAHEWLQKAADAPFMTQAFLVPPGYQDRVPAIVHVDGTTRPHLVDKNANPRYWTMIDYFRQLTGLPLVLNTSFNLRGEPIVCTPVEAIRDFYGTGLDALAIEDFILVKCKPQN